MAINVGSILFERYHVQAIQRINAAEIRYRVEDPAAGQYAVVVHHVSTAKTPDRLRVKLLDEMTYWKNDVVAPLLEHQYISGQGYFLLFETNQGSTLAERVAQNGLFRYQETIPILLNLCDALEYVNARGVSGTAASFTPQDVFLTATGKVLLIPSPIFAFDKKISDIEKTHQEIASLGKIGILMVTSLTDLPSDLSPTNGIEFLRQLVPDLPDSIAAVLMKSISLEEQVSYPAVEDFKAALLLAIIQIPPETLPKSPSVQTAAVLPDTPVEAAPTVNPPLPPVPEPTAPIRRRVPWGFV